MINKKVMALAVAGALAAPAAAFAQASNVQIYGAFDVSYNYINHSNFQTNAAVPVSTSGVNKTDIYNQSSRLGFKGTEDLGNGLKAWFQAESNIHSDGRQFNSTAGLGSRNTAVGLEGGWGTALLGNWDSPYKAAEGVWNNASVGGYVGHNNAIMHNNDSSGSNPNLNCNNTNTAATAAAGSPTCGQLEMATTSFSNRMANTLQYWSPVISGFQGRIALRANEEKNSAGAAGALGSNNPSAWAGSLNWSGGPAAVSFAYESHTGWRDVGVTAANVAATAGLTTPNNVKDNAWTLGGKYNFGVVELALAYERMKFGNAAATGAENDFQRKNWFLGLAAPIGNGALRFGYSMTPGSKSCGAGLNVAFAQCTGDTKSKLLSLGYEYNLSKRTAIYGVYAKMDNGSNATINFSTPVLTQAGTTAPALGAGQDVSVLGAGVKHSF